MTGYDAPGDAGALGDAGAQLDAAWDSAGEGGAPAAACGEPSVHCSSIPHIRPVLAYPLDGDLQNHGTSAGHEGIATGPMSYVTGFSGKALALPFGSSVTFPDTASVLSSASALTFSFWVRVPDPSTTELVTYLGCRSDKGFETYSGVGGGNLVTCAGYGGWPPPWGGCVPTDPCSLAQFTHFVLRWAGTGQTPEVAADGGPWATTHTKDRGGNFYPMPADFDLFQGAADLATGGGDGGGKGGFQIDDIRVYDRALGDDAVWKVTSCPLP